MIELQITPTTSSSSSTSTATSPRLRHRPRRKRAGLRNRPPAHHPPTQPSRCTSARPQPR